MDLISVIVPVYKVEQYLMRCVDSIRGQTYQNLEIILVDDGSPDRCPELCEEIKKCDSRVKVIHKENGGLGFARNSGLDIATGNYVTFIDSDDWISEDHIENLYREAQKADADVVIGFHTRINYDGTTIQYAIGMEPQICRESEILEKLVLPLIGTDVKDIQDIRLQPSSCMNLYRMDVIRDHNIRFPSERVAISEDMFFNIDCFCHAKCISVTNERGYFYFRNMSSLSQKYDAGRLARTECFYEAIGQKLAAYGLMEKAGYRLERTFLMDIRVLLRMIVFSDLTGKEKLQEIQRVLDHDLVKKVLADYPLDAYVPAMRMLKEHMRAGHIHAVYWLIRLRGFTRKATWLKSLLKQMGIGR